MRRISIALIALLVLPRFVLSQTKPAEDPTAIVAIIRDAEAKSRAQQWPEAAALWERALQLNPTHPNGWHNLGVARFYAKDYKAAIPAFEQAAELGAPTMGPYFSVYNIACAHALAGEKEQAISSLQRALDMGFPNIQAPAKDEDFASIRDDPRFQKMLG